MSCQIRTVIYFLAVFVSSAGFASADYSLMKNLVGQYSILDWNGDLKSGTVTISADENGVGYTVTPLNMASDPVTASSLITSQVSTTLTQNGNVVSQDSTDSTGHAIHIEYTTNDGYLTVSANDSDINLTTGKSPGTPLDPKTFFAEIAGMYIIDSAGGAPPEGQNNQAEVDITDNTSLAAFYMPYCLPTNCDLGYTPFNYSGTSVFERQLGSSITAFEILTGSGSSTSTRHYTWVVNNNVTTFLNYQYSRLGQTVCLEHVIHKASHGSLAFHRILAE
jgi:hypothetical protein